MREGDGDGRAGEDQIVSKFDFHFQFVCVCCCCVCVASNDAVCGGDDDMTMLLMTKMTIKSAVRSTKEPTGILCVCVSMAVSSLLPQMLFIRNMMMVYYMQTGHTAVSGRGNYRISFAAPTSCSHTECSPCESAGWGRPPFISLSAGNCNHMKWWSTHSSTS